MLMIQFGHTGTIPQLEKDNIDKQPKHNNADEGKYCKRKTNASRGAKTRKHRDKKIIKKEYQKIKKRTGICNTVFGMTSIFEAKKMIILIFIKDFFILT